MLAGYPNWIFWIFPVQAPRQIAYLRELECATAAALACLCAKCYAEAMDILSLVDRGDLDLIRQRIFGATAAELNAASIKKRITPLHRAVAMNRPDIAALLLDHGADIDPRDNYGVTPLHMAAGKGHTECVLALLDAGADPNATNKDGNAALHLSAPRGHAKCVTALLEAGANTEITNKNSRTPLVLACARKATPSHCIGLLLKSGAKATKLAMLEVANRGCVDIDSLCHLLHADKSLLGETISKRRTILHLLASEKQLSGDVTGLATILSDAQPVVNQLDKQGNTALHYAVMNRKTSLVRLLLDVGADVNVKSKKWWGTTALHQAVYKKDEHMVSVLLEAGADVHAIDQDGSTPLHYAAAEGGVGNIQILIDRGADANAAENDGNTPLNRAISNNHMDCIKLLLPLTDKANIDSQKRPPILIAARNGNIDSVRMLLAAGADPNLPSDSGASYKPPVFPLGVALSNYYEEITETLLQCGALPETAYGALRDMYEDFGADTREPEERKLLRKRRDMLSIMLRHGLDPARAVSGNRDGDTLLHTLCRHGAPVEDIVKLLKHDRTLANTFNASGDTPLHCYLKNANPMRIGVVEALLDAGADATIQNGAGRPLLSLLNRHYRVPERLRELLLNAGAQSDDTELSETRTVAGDAACAM